MIINQRKFAECCTKIGSGATPKGGKTVYCDNGISFIRSQNVYNLCFSYDGLAHISDEAAEKLKNVSVHKDDVLLNITGDSVARSCLVPTNILPARVSQHVSIIRSDKTVLNPHFLCYYLVNPSMQAYMLKLAVGKGASRNAITKEMIENFTIIYPDLSIQEKIVHILSAYDTLIENNQKQIKLLEEAAQRLYKEWFVDFHFPGYEKVSISNGVPDGWNLKSIENCLSYYVNGGWGKEDITSNNTSLGSVIRGTDILDIKNGNFQSIPKRYHTQKDIEKKKLMPNDIVFELSNGNIDNIGRSLLISPFILKTCGKNAICASFCKLLRPINSMYAALIYWEIQEMQHSGKMLPLKKHGANGINNFDFDGFLDHKLLVPCNELVEPFSDILLCISNLLSQITYLKEARDRLLPKLMSGEIEICA